MAEGQKLITDNRRARHDYELLDARRRTALTAVLLLLARRRRPVALDELAAELGIAEGPELGAALAELEAAQYAGEVTDRDSAPPPPAAPRRGRRASESK